MQLPQPQVGSAFSTQGPPRCSAVKMAVSHKRGHYCWFSVFCFVSSRYSNDSNKKPNWGRLLLEELGWPASNSHPGPPPPGYLDNRHKGALCFSVSQWSRKLDCSVSWSVEILTLTSPVQILISYWSERLICMDNWSVSETRTFLP